MATHWVNLPLDFEFQNSISKPHPGPAWDVVILGLCSDSNDVTNFLAFLLVTVVILITRGLADSTAKKPRSWRTRITQMRFIFFQQIQINDGLFIYEI